MKTLVKDDYFQVLAQVKEIPFNTLFAQAVLEERVNGAVFVDDLDTPSSYYVVHEYGMSLLFGSLSDEFLENEFLPYAIKSNSQRHRKEMMQIFPLGKEEKINNLLNSESLRFSGTKENKYPVQFHRRINFKFNAQKFEPRTGVCNEGELAIFPITQETFDTFGELVAPRFFWKSYVEFEATGKGFELRKNGVVIAIAFSAFITETELELGMEVLASERKYGYGSWITSFLIENCIANGREPVWSCNYSNKASYHLAKKLGFIPVLDLPYYEIA